MGLYRDIRYILKFEITPHTCVLVWA